MTVAHSGDVQHIGNGPIKTNVMWVLALSDTVRTKFKDYGGCPCNIVNQQFGHKLITLLHL